MATYAIEGMVTRVIPCMRALPARVAVGSLSTELGDVNMCLYAWRGMHVTDIGEWRVAKLYVLTQGLRFEKDRSTAL